MEIRAKIGTGSVSVIRVYRKRKMPQLGEVIRFRSVPEIAGEKWRRAKVEEIRQVGYPFYFLSLW